MSNLNSSPYATHWLTKFLAPFQQYNAWNSALKECIGSNIPHLALVASVGEFWDQFISQAGNTVLVFGGGFSLDKLADTVFHRLNPEKFTQGLSLNAQESYNLGKGFVIYPMIAASVIATPFLRNAIMSHAMKTDNFVQLAGVKGSKQPENLPETPAHQKTRLAKEKKDLLTAGKIMGVGSLLGLASFLATHHAIVKDAPLPAWMKKEIKPFWQKETVSFNGLFTLPKGDFRNVQDVPLYLFWGLGAYTGMLLASRDLVEFTESMAKTVWFGFAFMIAPRLVEPYLDKLFVNKSNAFLGSASNMTYVAKLAVGSVLYAGMPTVMNRVFRRERAKEAGLLVATTPQNPVQLYAAAPSPQMLSSLPRPTVGVYQTRVMMGI